MTEISALAKVFDQSDAAFFAQHSDRKAHIRKCYKGECEAEFQTLGWHQVDRRRILLCRSDFENKPLPERKVMKIPFLLFADETVEDTDAILLPIIEDIMYGVKARIEQ